MNATGVQKQQVFDIQAKISYCECPSSTMLIYGLPQLSVHGNTFFPTVTLHVHLKFIYQKSVVNNYRDRTESGTQYYCGAYV